MQEAATAEAGVAGGGHGTAGVEGGGTRHNIGGRGCKRQPRQWQGTGGLVEGQSHGILVEAGIAGGNHGIRGYGGRNSYFNT